MNLLIIGGLLVIAVAAIIGMVFLLITEGRSATSKTTYVPGAHTASLEMHESVPHMGTDPSGQNSPVAIENEQPAEGEGQLGSLLDGQFHELAAEIRALHQRAGEIEQGLSALTEAVDRIEREQDGVELVAQG